MNYDSNKKLNEINTDLRLMRQFIKPTFQRRICPPKNLGQLSNLLRNRNSRLNISQEERERGQIWLNRKGVDVEPLVEKIRLTKKQTSNKVSKKKVQQDCYFYFTQINISNQKQYLAKAVEYGAFNLLQKTMCYRSIRKDFTNKILNRVNIISSDQTIDSISGINNIGSYVRSKEKKNCYIQIIKSLVQNQDPIANCIGAFRERVKTKFWDIMFGHLKMATNSRDNTCIVRFMIASLKMVQSEFNDILPYNNDSIGFYINNNYIDKLQNHENYIRDHDNGPYWAKAFMLYRAGRKVPFYQLLSIKNQRQLLKQVFESDENIKKNNPIKSTFRDEIRTTDIFRDQLIYSIRGESKYSSECLSNPNTLDMVWIFLRSMGIFYNIQKSRFDELLDQLVKSYKTQYINPSQIINMFYLLAYVPLAQLGVNQLLDKDDYLHFLLVLVYNPVLIDPKDQPKIRKMLTEQLISYIYELMTQNKKEYLHYMMIVPDENLPNQVSSIIARSELIKSIDWKFLKKHLNRKLFEDLVIATLTKYVTISKNYILIANQYYDLLGQRKMGLELLIRMLIKSVLSVKFTSNEINNALNLAIKWCSQDQILSIKYRPIFQLFKSNNKIQSLIKQNNPDKLLDFIKNSQHIILDSRINSNNARVFEQLIKYDGFEVYLIFVKKVVVAAEIALSSKSMASALRSIQSSILSSLNDIMSDTPYSTYTKKENAINLISHLKQSLWTSQ